MSRMSSQSGKRRTIRSYVRRSGRLTSSQGRALQDLWPDYGVDYRAAPLDLDEIFGREAPRVLEIGFGNGDSLVQQAKQHPDLDFLGIEVHEPGIGRCLLAAREAGIDNLRVIAHDAVEVLEHQIDANALDRVNLYFPDPWPKKRHHKRRILQPRFVELLAEKISPDGSLHIATDWQDYAEHIDELLGASDAFRLSERREHAGDRPLDRPTTKFERRGLELDHRIWDWRFERVASD